MKRIIGWSLVLLIIGTLAWMGYSDWHVKRNTNNLLPNGSLDLVADNAFVDDSDRTWLLQPHSKNIFHQPGGIAELVEKAYPILDTVIAMDVDNPNLKFLSEDGNGGSYEAILQPDGTWLTTGILQGTYNYCHPSGFMGSLGHFFVDMLPGFVNSNYPDLEAQQ